MEGEAPLASGSKSSKQESKALSSTRSRARAREEGRGVAGERYYDWNACGGGLLGSSTRNFTNKTFVHTHEKERGSKSSLKLLREVKRKHVQARGK